MKTTYCIGIFAVLCCANGYAQSEVKIIQATEIKEAISLPKQEIKAIQTEQIIVNELPEEELSQGEVQFFEARRYKNQHNVVRTLEIVTMDIANVQAKIEAVNSDEQARNEALASGWFDRAYARLLELENEKQQLENN